MRHPCSSVVVATFLVLFAVAHAPGLSAQAPQVAPRPGIGLPDEAAGRDEVVRALIAAFDRFDIVALGEVHRRRSDSDLRIALVRHPDFAKKVRSIVVEFASTTEQPTLDRYIRGEDVPSDQLAQVWRTTTQAANRVWESPIYADFFAAVRDVNSRLPADMRIRVLGGDPGPGDTRSRETAAATVLREQVLQKHGKALAVYGAGHFWRGRPMDEQFLSMQGPDIGIPRMLDIDYPGRTFAVIPLGGPDNFPPAFRQFKPDRDDQKFDRALKSPLRPVLVSLQRPPFRDYSAEEFVDPVIICRPPATPQSSSAPASTSRPPSSGSPPPPPPPPSAGLSAEGCRSVLKGSSLTLAQMADAAIYFGREDDPIVPTKK